jgi:acyl-CoA thioesterase-1
MEQFNPQILIIELGGNDGLRGLGNRQTQDHLDQMITLAREADSRPLLLGMMLPPNFGKAFSEKFLGIYRELAEQRDVPLVPFFLQGVADRPEWMQGDGIHPNAAGQPLMLEHVWERLQPMLGESMVSDSRVHSGTILK